MDLSPYLDRIRAWNPTLDIRAARADPHGLNNLVIVINDEWVCRFPRNDESRGNLAREAQLLAAIRRYVNVAVPDFSVDEERDFVAYHMLAGRPIYRHDLLRLSDATQDRFAADLAAFLRDLHAIPPAALAASDLLPAPLLPDSRRAPASPASWSDHLAAVRAELYPHLWAYQHAYIEDVFAPVIDGRLNMADYVPALIHNDLASYHLLGDPATGRLRGVLDFGEAGWGDPAADYAILINTYGESFVRRMAVYNAAITALLDRARFRAAYVELEWALKGMRTNNPEWFLVHLGRARDSRPIERN